MQRFNDYVAGIQSGAIVSCEEVKLAIQRHVNDLSRKDIYFDEDEAQDALDFFELLNLNSSAEDFKAFELQPFQCFIVGCLFGWKKKHNHKRKYNRAYIEIARKNGKTFFAAGISLYMMLVDGENKPEIYIGANSKQQARICFKDAKDMVEASPALSKYVTLRSFHMECTRPSKAVFRYVSADSSKHDGLRPHGVILDEIHEFKTNALYNIFASAMGNRKQPMILMITTAGFNKTYWCYRDQRSFMQKVLRNEAVADNMFAIIYTLDKGDEYTDPSVWIKANPNLGVSVDEEYLAQEVHTALVKPEDRVGIVTKNFNMWMDASSVWIASEMWRKLAKPREDKELKGLTNYGGADLSTVEDITAYSLLFDLPEGKKYLKNRFFVPLDTAKARQEATGVPYLDWIKAGHLIGVEGNTIDYEVIRNMILADLREFNFYTMGFDTHEAHHIRQELNKMSTKISVKVDKKTGGGTWVQIPRFYGISQHFKSVSPSAKEFIRLVYSGEIEHDGNPVMGWMLGNVEIVMDTQGNIRPDKGKSKNKIDGVVSTLLSIEQSLFWSAQEIRDTSVYEKRKAVII